VILNAFKEQSSIEKNKLQSQLISARTEHAKLIEELKWHKNNATIVDKDAKTIVRRGKEISHLKQEIASLHQKLESALSRRSTSDRTKIETEMESRSVLEKRIKHIEFELKDRDECIDKLLRANHQKNQKNQQNDEIDDNSVIVRDLDTSIEKIGTSIDKPGHNSGYDKQKIEFLQNQLQEAHLTIERVTNDNNNLKTKIVDVVPYKKEMLVLKGQLVRESQKVGALNGILLEEKKSGKVNKNHVNEQEKANKELKHLLLESNEKLQLALQREQHNRLESNDYLQELEAFRRQDINGVNAILFEKLNMTRARISQLESSHKERLDVISKMQVANIDSESLFFGSNDNPQVVNDCQTELSELMSVVGTLHQQLRCELD